MTDAGVGLVAQDANASLPAPWDRVAPAEAGERLSRRLAALRAAGLLDTPAEEQFDRLTRIAGRLLAAPISLVSLVTADRQFFKSARGLPEPVASRRQLPLSHSFCRHVVEEDAPLVVPDARVHPLVRDNPVVREMGVVAYLGVPLRTPDGTAIGALCVIDRTPRSWARQDVEVLADIAATAEAELALRERARALAEARRRLEDAIESMPDAFTLFDADERLVVCNSRCGEFFPRSAELLLPGARYVDLVRAGVERGDFGQHEDLEGFVQAAAARHRAGGTYELRLGDGRWLHVATRRTSDGGIVALRRDITERKLVEQAVEHLAMHDTLTGLPNRRMFRRELDRARARAARGVGRLVVALIDLDGFKQVNDSQGHDAGDALLVEVGRRLSACVRRGDMAARLGGDEFAVVSEVAAGDPPDPAPLAERLLAALGAPAEIGGVRLRPAVSIGLTAFPDDPGEGELLLRHADQALYAAKAAGRGTWRAYAPATAGAPAPDTTAARPQCCPAPASPPAERSAAIAAAPAGAARGRRRRAFAQPGGGGGRSLTRRQRATLRPCSSSVRAKACPPVPSATK